MVRSERVSGFWQLVPSLKYFPCLKWKIKFTCLTLFLSLAFLLETDGVWNFFTLWWCFLNGIPVRWSELDPGSGHEFSQLSLFVESALAVMVWLNLNKFCKKNAWRITSINKELKIINKLHESLKLSTFPHEIKKTEKRLEIQKISSCFARYFLDRMHA